MMLVRNGRSVYQNPGLFTGAVYGQYGNSVKGGRRNRFVNGLSPIFGGYPNGSLSPGSFILPQKPGSLASYTLANVALSTTGTLVPARNLVGSSALTLVSTNAQLDQIVSCVASSVLQLTATAANLAAAAGASGSASLSLTAGSVTCGAIFSVSATATLSISTASSFLTAIAHLDADAGGPTELSPEGLAAALLDNNDVETGFSVRNSMRLMLASLAGKLSGAPGTSITIKNTTDDKNRIVATVDSNGNRTSLTYDLSD